MELYKGTRSRLPFLSFPAYFCFVLCSSFSLTLAPLSFLFSGLSFLVSRLSSLVSLSLSLSLFPINRHYVTHWIVMQPWKENPKIFCCHSLTTIHVQLQKRVSVFRRLRTASIPNTKVLNVS